MNTFENTEKDILKILGEGMQSETDYFILSDMLLNLGWKRMVLPIHNRKKQILIHQWCEEHINYSYECQFGIYIFENEGDAVNFAMKWC